MRFAKMEESTMLKSAVSSHLTTIYTARKSRENYFINLKSKFNGDDTDILDIIENGLKNASNFNLLPIDKRDDEGNQTHPRKAKLIGNIQKDTISKDGFKLYKYLFFRIEYGENGQNLRIEKSDGTGTRVDVDDWQHREFYVFLAYKYGNEDRGVLLLESRGQYSIQGPVVKIIKNCISNLPEGFEKMSIDIKPFADDRVIRSYIQSGRVSKLRLIKNIDPVERGQGMMYDEKEIIFKRPREGKIADVLLGIANNTYRVGQLSNVPEIDGFEPDKIKFEVETESGKKTYSAGNPRMGLIQEEMPKDVVQADGVTNGVEILKEMKRIFETQHISL